MKKAGITILILVVVIVVAYGFYVFNKRTPSLENISPAYTLTANELYQEFSADEVGALKKYEGKVLQVTGAVLSVKKTDSASSIILNAEDALFGAVNGSFMTLEEKPEKEGIITVKGRCHGYLTSVILNNCVIVE